MTNRKLHVHLWLTPRSMTLDDLNNNNNNKRQFVRRRNMSVDITRAPYRQSGNAVRDSSTETRLWVIWLYKKMGFQALFKFVKCWRDPDVVRETVPSSWGGDGERALAEFQTSAQDKQCVMSSWPQWRPRTNWSDGYAKFGDVRRCQARKCPIHHQTQLEQDPLPYSVDLGWH